MTKNFILNKLSGAIFLFLGMLVSQAQVDPGVDFDLNGYINDRLDAGQTTVIVPPGRYRVTQVGGRHLFFSNRKNATVVADGVEMICNSSREAIRIENCDNFKIQGLTIDYDPLPFTQAVITAMSPDKNTVTAEFIEGYSSFTIDGKIEIFDPNTSELVGPAYYNTTCQVSADNRFVTISKGGSSSSPEEIGDIVVINSGSDSSSPMAIHSRDCIHLVMENITLYSGSMFGFYESYCDGSEYINCLIDRQSLENDVKVRGLKRMRSNNVDGFHSKHAKVGPKYIGCVCRYNGDDCFAINGDFHVITETNANQLIVVGKGGNPPNLVIGETVELISYTGERMPDSVITNIQIGRALNTQEINFLQTQNFKASSANTYTASNVYVVTIDRSVNMPMGSLINSAEQIGNGFEIRNCIAGPNRSRGILVKSGNGIITGNTCVDNWGQAIKMSPEYSWLEAGSGSNIIVSNNTITGCHDAAIAIYSKGGSDNTSPVGAHDNVKVINNNISGSSNPGIAITSSSNLCLENNTISSPDNSLLAPWLMNNFGRNEDPNRQIYLVNNSSSDCSLTMVNLRVDVIKYLFPLESVQLIPTVIPEEFVVPQLVWESENQSIATVNNSGLVTAVAEGETHIFVSTQDGKFRTSCTIVVSIGDNLAHLKPVTVAVESDPASNLVDENESTRWSAQFFPQSAEIDLGDVYDITSFELYPFDTRDYQYIIQAKTLQGDVYTTVVDRSNNITSDVKITDDVSLTARYLKVTVMGANTYSGTWVALNEFKAFGRLAESLNIDQKAFLDDRVFIYPNPVDGYLTLDLNDNLQEASVSIVDLSGRVLLKKEVEEQTSQLDLTSFSKGLYLLLIERDHVVIETKRLVVD